jgi:maltose O-acetyltransferase
MTDTNFSKMQTGDWYSCIDDELFAFRVTARAAIHEHNTMHPNDRAGMGPKLHALLANVAANVLVEAPFHCAYGFNIHLSQDVFLNAGCVILDSAPVRIGARSMLGPAVHIYCADHHRDTPKRAAGVERALPVTLGADVWIGGGAIILPGITIGEGAIIGAGSVVTRDVPPGSRVAGNPARALPSS